MLNCFVRAVESNVLQIKVGDRYRFINNHICDLNGKVIVEKRFGKGYQDVADYNRIQWDDAIVPMLKFEEIKRKFLPRGRTK